MFFKQHNTDGFLKNGING